MVHNVIDVHLGCSYQDGWREVIDKDGFSYGFINLSITGL